LAPRLALTVVPVRVLAAEVGLSERQLRRRCGTAFGYPPSVLRRLLRLQRFLRSAIAITPERPSLAVLAAAAGYADQAHLARELAPSPATRRRRFWPCRPGGALTWPIRSRPSMAAVPNVPSTPPMTARSAVTQPDEMMTRIGHGIELSQGGHRDQARRLFAELWEQIGPQGDALLRCALAHSMADVQDDPHDEHLGPPEGGFAGCGHGERRTNSQRQRTTRYDLPQLPPDDAALAEDLRHPVSVARNPSIMYQERVLSPVVTGPWSRTVTPRSCPVPGVTWVRP